MNNEQIEKILVTGGAGFIGSWLVKRLLNDGKQVVVLDDLSSGSLDNLPSKHVNLEVVTGSVLDPTEVRRVTQGIDLVFHLAGVVGMRLATTQRDLSYRIPTEGTVNILKETDNTPIILFSSSAVYGYTKDGRSQENLKLLRDGALEYDGGIPGYATGKWEMEQLGLAAAQQGRSVLCVRPFNVVGPGQSGTYGMVLPTFVQRALMGKPLHVYDDGTQSRTFSGIDTFIESIVRIVRLVENHSTFSKVGHILNIGATKPTKIRELAQIVLEETGCSVPIEYIPYHNVFPNRRDVQWRVPDVHRMNELIGTLEWPSIREIVQSVVSYTTNRLSLDNVHQQV